MDQIENWNEYCEMLADLESDLVVDESEAYLAWLAQQDAYLFADQMADLDAQTYGVH